ncbi:hypothetical protein SAMN05518861_12610 [Mesorhizobium sp. YR577]|nr:hypothetical protein SAMN05518861_12610 [Mesorhizobium sp. YR577]
MFEIRRLHDRAGSKLTKTDRLAWRILPIQSTSPPADIMPGTVFEPDLVVDTDRFEANLFMQSDASRVGQGNPRISRTKQLPFKDCQQLFIEQATDASAACFFCDIGCDIHGPAIGGSGAMLPGVGVAKDATVSFCDEVRIVEQGPLDPSLPRPSAAFPRRRLPCLSRSGHRFPGWNWHPPPWPLLPSCFYEFRLPAPK